LLLLEQIEIDLKAAMKQREAGKTRLAALRLLKATLHNARIEKGRALTESEANDVLAREVNIRREMISEFERAERPDRLAEVKGQLEVLLTYLPPQLSDSELNELIHQAISQVGAQGPADKGKVMAILMPQIKGRADGRQANGIVSRLLGKD